MSGKQIRDVLYKYVTIPPKLMRVVDTPEFQTLRRIRQLGFVCQVYPSANHTRFEHLLGACHLAGVALKMLNEQQPELFISPILIETVQLAALTHDLGHTAFSHLFDNSIVGHLDVPTEMRTHEGRSILLLKHMNTKYGFGFSDSQLDLVGHMILGVPTATVPRWWFHWVSNPDFDLDIDKLDYLARDSHAIGMPRDLQIERILSHARVVNNSLAFHSKVAELIVDVFRHRHKMHCEVYRHRVNVAFDHMATKILQAVAKVQGWSALFSDTATHAWRDITDDVLHQVPALAKLYPTAEMAEALVLYNRFMLRQHPRSRIIRGHHRPPDKRKEEVQTVIVGFTSRLEDNPLKRIQCFDSFQTLKLRSLLECGVSEISATHPGEQLCVVFEEE